MEHAFVDHVDDIALDAVGKLGGEIAGEEDRGFGMNGEMGIPELFVNIAGAVRLEDRGIVDEQGKRAEAFGGAGDERLALDAFAEIGLEDFGAAPFGADAGTHGFGAIGIGAIVDDDGVASHGQREGDGRADAVTGAGDQGDRSGLIRDWIIACGHRADHRPDRGLLQSAAVRIGRR
jgi:hypothetical protein